MFRIKRIPQYYAGTLGVREYHFVEKRELEDDLTGSCSPAEFETYEEAERFIEEEEQSPYYCGHGETGRPEYEIITIK